MQTPYGLTRSPDDITLVYVSVDGESFATQPLRDIPECGTLIDENDEDMQLVGYLFAGDQ